ncbi:galactose/methyl galactoside ABC transporter permease MglC [Dysosmobacter sp.]
MSNESKTLEKEARAKARAQQPWTARRAADLVLNNALIIIMVVAVIYIAIVNNNFIKPASIVNILAQTCAYLPVALGVGGCIVLTGTDLSAGRIVGLTACISASLLQAVTASSKMWVNLTPPPVLLVLVAAMLVGAAIGAFNGFFVAKFKLHPFIVTLASQLIIYTFLLLYMKAGNNGGMAISGLDKSYSSFITGCPQFIKDLTGGISIPNYVWIALLLTVVMWFIWNKTTFGKNMFALGANEEAARVSGVNVFATTIMVFALAGAMYAVTGFIEGARVASNTANTGLNYESDAIAACVIGGVSFVGGIGKIRGVVIGVLMLRLIFVGLNMIGVNQDLFYIIKGGIILFACALDMRKYLVKK